MDIDRIRQDIPGLDRTVYLNTGGKGLSPQIVTGTVFDAYRYMLSEGPDAPPVKDWMERETQAARTKVAIFLGVDPDEIALLRSVSEGINIVAKGLPWQAGDDVILTDQEHPTGLLPWFSLRKRAGVELKMVELTEDRDELLARFADAITPRTKLLSLSHVTAENGLRLPAKEIIELAHQHGAQVLFDGAQSVGQFPIDLRDIGADYYALTAHKWLCGGIGVGAFYARRELIDELDVSWTGAGATAELDRLRGDFTWQPGARRFEFGGRAWPLYFGFRAVLDYFDEFGGPAWVETRAGELADGLKRELAAIHGVKVITPLDPAMSAGIVSFEIDGRTGQEAALALWERWRIVCRPAMGGTATRLSIAFFTSSDEVQTVREAVATLASEAVG